MKTKTLMVIDQHNEIIELPVVHDIMIEEAIGKPCPSFPLCENAPINVIGTENADKQMRILGIFSTGKMKEKVLDNMLEIADNDGTAFRMPVEILGITYRDGSGEHSAYAPLHCWYTLCTLSPSHQLS